MKTIINKQKAGNLSLKKVAGSILTVGFLLSGTATFAQERINAGNTDVDEFGQYDTNQDMNWDRGEFDRRMTESEAYKDWDTDQSGDINESEFNEGTLNWEDRQRQDYPDADDQEVENKGGVNVEENNMRETNGLGTFRDWDTDQSGAIDQNEFKEGTYTRWDADRDGVVSNDEYNEGINTFEGSEENEDLGPEETETEMGTEGELNNEVEEAETEIEE